MRIVTRFLLVATTLVVLVSCAPQTVPPNTLAAQPAAAPQGKNGTALSVPGKPLNIGTPAEPSALGGKFMGGVTGVVDFPFLFHAKLTQYDQNGAITPVLVDRVPTQENGDWEVLEDATMTTTYRLRPGLTWQDGAPFTADDVRFTWQAIMNPQLPSDNRDPERLVSGIDVPDPQTVVVHWKQLYIYANAWNLEPLPQHIFGPLVTDLQAWTNSPAWSSGWVGLGPYRLSEWAQGSYLRGQAYSDFALGAPKIQTVTVYFVTDPNQAVARFLAGEFDITTTNLIRSEEGQLLQQQLGPQGLVSVLAIPVKLRYGLPQFRDPAVPWVRDVRVRQALMYALDRQSMADVLINGLAPPADMYLTPNDPAYPAANQAITKYPFDPNRAIATLQQAGWTRGADGVLQTASGERFPFEVRTTPDVQGVKEAQMLADMWKQVGIDTSVFLIPNAEINNQEYRAKYPGITTTSVSTLEGFYLTSDTIPSDANHWKGNNRGGYSSAEGDQLQLDYLAAIDPAKRSEVLVQTVKLVSEQLPYLPFYYQVDVHPIRAGLQGVTTRWPFQPGITFGVFQWYWTS